MKVSFFIDRPVFSIVISILIVIVGTIGLTMLPIDQYPQITPPVVKISASYPGAGALTVAQAVATPIEQQLNGTPGMIYMESSSSNSGSFSATVTFDISTDPELAAVDIQNAAEFRRLEAVAAHAGIDLHMSIGHNTPLQSQRAEHSRILRGANGSDHIQIQHLLQFGPVTGRPQHENLCRRIQVPDDFGLGNLRHGKPGHAGHGAQLCHGTNAQTVAVAFQHGPYGHTIGLFQ